MKIGVFDSGIGGMTVLKELIKTFPNENFVYYGDTANVPYGTKSSSQIRNLCQEAACSLKTKNLDVLVIACNTASAIALDVFKKILFPLPVFGVVEPGVSAVVEQFQKLPFDPQRRILILGTKATIKSQIYSLEIRKAIAFNQISEQSCPLAVPMIEEGWVNSPILLSTLQEYVKTYQHDKIPGIALLACTHYPWAMGAFQKVLPNWNIVDSAKAVAEFLLRQQLSLSQKNDLTVQWIFTDPEAVTPMALNDFQQMGLTIAL